MLNLKRISILFFLSGFSYFTVSATDVFQKLKEDTIPLYSDGVVKKSIYPQTASKRTIVYNYLMGKHYRDLYFTPVTVKTTKVYDLYGGLKFVDQLPQLHALFFEDHNSHLYMIKPLSGAAAFIESDFFKNIYNRQEFEGTYMNRVIGDAYTITHPYAFLVANKLAKKVNVCSFDSEIFYIPKHTTTDTIADGSEIGDRLISVFNLQSFNAHAKKIQTEELLEKIKESKSFHVDQKEYIRERLFGLLVGDWNQTKESWQWNEIPQGDSLVYMPVVSDRSHAFTRVDGLLFKPMLSVLGLKGITNYDSNIKNLKKANGIAIPLDAALVANSGREIWYQEAKYIKSVLTDEVIDGAFKVLPHEIYVLPSTNFLKETLKVRRDALEQITQKYYDILQQTPVITGTNSDDLFVIEQKDKRLTDVKIYDRESNKLLFNKEYDHITNEIWLYGLDGKDAFRVSGSEKGIPIVLVGGKGENKYSIEGGKNTDIYEYKSHNPENDTLGNAKIIRTNLEKVIEYDYKKSKYETFGFTPWGVYDSDLGFYLGVYFSKTMYGFKRSPYSYQHRFGYSYLDGLMYQGFFPTLNEKKGFNIEAIFGIANDFENFFGYGNQTLGFKDKPNDYNRVGVAKYSVEPSFFWKFNIKDKDKVTASSMLELYDIEKSTDRYINEVYREDNSVFDAKFFLNLKIAYEMHKALSAKIPSFDVSVTPGWTINLQDADRNVPYLKSKLAFELVFTDRITMATEVQGTALFTDKYEFYQAAAVKLRGFRDDRFIGKQSLYQQTDFRYDLGHLKNPFTPIQYGVFAGVDYGRVWYPYEHSEKWHSSYGLGFWLTMFKKYTGKFSYFDSNDGGRFYIGFGMGF